MTAALGDTTHCVHARGDQQHARHAQEARECRLRLVFLPFSPLGARVGAPDEDEEAVSTLREAVVLRDDESASSAEEVIET